MRRLVVGMAIVTIAALAPARAFADDQEIAQHIVQQLNHQKELGNLRGFEIDMQVDKGTVWMKGRVSTPEQQDLVLQIAAQATDLGVQQVVNDIRVQPVSKPAATPAPSKARNILAGLSEAVQAPFQSHSSAPAQASRRTPEPVAQAAVAETPVKEAAIREVPVPQVAVREVPVPQVAVREVPVRQAAVREVPVREVTVKEVVVEEPVSYPSPLRSRAVPSNEFDYHAGAVGSGIGTPPQVAARSPSDVQPVPVQPYQGQPYQAQPYQLQPAPAQFVPAQRPYGQMPLAYAPAQSVGYNYNQAAQPGYAAAPVPAYMPSYGGVAPAAHDHPQMPPYAWPAYAAHPNYAAVTYPRQYSPTAWPYIGPFYPYPQVPLGWRKVTLEWDDGWWMLDFKDH